MSALILDTPRPFVITARSAVFVALLAHLFLSLVRPINDPDFWWHLRTGEYILSNGIPRADIFSYTAFGKEWIAHEWLGQALMYALYSLGSWPGLILASSLITAAVFLFLAAQTKARALVVFIVTAVAHAAALPVIRDPRPRLASFVFTAVFLVVLRNHAKGGSANFLWALPALMVLWVNLHAGYPLGILLLCVALAAVAYARDWTRFRVLFIFLIACGACIALNPYGLRMYAYPLETIFSPVQRAVITEWASPDFHDPQARPLLLFIMGIVAILAFSRLKVKTFDLLCLLVAFALTLTSERHVTLLSLVAIPLLCEQVDHLWNRPEAKSVAGPLIIGILVVALNFPIVLGTFRNPLNLTAKPVNAIRFVEENRLADNLFSRYEWNDYLIWTTKRKVFIDGRPDMYGDQFVAEYLEIYNAGQWQPAFDRYGVNTALVEPGSAIARELKRAGWSERYRDAQAVVFSR